MKSPIKYLTFETQLVKNLKSLGFDPKSVSQNGVINKPLFPPKANCVKNFETVSYFLFSKLNKVNAKKVFKAIWPLKTAKDSFIYRNKAFSWLSDLCLKTDTPFRKSHLNDCRGENLCEMMMVFSSLVVSRKKEDKKPAVMKKKEVVQVPVEKKEMMQVPVKKNEMVQVQAKKKRTAQTSLKKESVDIQPIKKDSTVKAQAAAAVDVPASQAYVKQAQLDIGSFKPKRNRYYLSWEIDEKLSRLKEEEEEDAKEIEECEELIRKSQLLIAGIEEPGAEMKQSPPPPAAAEPELTEFSLGNHVSVNSLRYILRHPRINPGKRKITRVEEGNHDHMYIGAPPPDVERNKRLKASHHPNIDISSILNDEKFKELFPTSAGPPTVTFK